MSDKTKYFLDAEFIEDGRTIDLLSVALVCEDGREFYAVNTDADRTRASEWVEANVIPHLDTLPDPGAKLIRIEGPRPIIAKQVLEFTSSMFGDRGKPEFWGYYADYDWVVFCQLFGTMMQLPKGFPMYCMDIKQLCKLVGDPVLPPQKGTEHHALLDARWNKVAYEFLCEHARVSHIPFVGL